MMNHHTLILISAVIILLLVLYVFNISGKKEGNEFYRYRRQCNCNACNAGDWQNCSVSCEIECS